jgi:hypothetical protein
LKADSPLHCTVPSRLMSALRRLSDKGTKFRRIASCPALPTQKRVQPAWLVSVVAPQAVNEEGAQ